MYRFRRRALKAPTFAVVAAALAVAALPAHAAPEPYETVAAADGEDAAQTVRLRTTALSNADRLSYTNAFDALRRGDLDAARDAARRADDRVLVGQVEFERLFHDNHVATFEELSAWLEDYSDLPSAPRVHALAMRRRPDGAPEPRRPVGTFVTRTWEAVAAGGGNSEGDPAKAARVALNRDDLSSAVVLGEQIGDWWTVGLAAWRLGDFHKAFDAFERVATDPTEDAWTRAGAGVWAARAAGQSGRHDRITEFLSLSARWPATFYGQIALRQLGREPVIVGDGPTPYEAVSQTASLNDEPIGVNQREMDDFLRSEPRARRTVAFYEVGRRLDARDELRNGLRTASDRTRRLWTGLARVLGPRLGGGSGDATRIRAEDYPMPEIAPDGGWSLPRSLVYAIARKESSFNAGARSPVGAYGLMQVMPTTAAEMTGDRGFVTEPQRLFQPATNVRLGQTYVNRMLARPEFRGDLLRAVASYNAGPGPMLGALRRLGPNPDPLLLIETIDVPQAREYVEKVVAAYWIYQRMSGAPLNTLDAVVAGQPLIPVGLDWVAPPQAPEAEQPVLVAVTAPIGTR